MSDTELGPYSSPWRRWYALLILLLIYSCHYLDRSVIGVLVQPIKQEFGLSDGQIGLLTGLVYSISFALVAIPLGALIDRTHRKNLLALLIVAWSALTALSGRVQDYGQLLLARAGVGAAESGGSPAAMSMIADIFPQDQRARAMGLFFLSTAIGLFAANMGGGWVAQNYGWRAAFMVAGVPGIVLALLLLLTVAEPVRQAPGQDTSKRGIRPTLTFIARHPILPSLMLGMVLWAFCAAAASAFSVAFLQRSHGMTLSEAGLAVALTAGLCGALGAATGGFIADHLAKRGLHRPLWFLSLTTAVAASVAFVALTTEDTTRCLILLGVWHLIAGFYFGPSYGIAVSLAPPHMRGSSIATLQVGTNLLGYGFGPYLTGLLSDAFEGPHALRNSLATVVCIYFVVAGLFAHAAIVSRTRASRAA